MALLAEKLMEEWLNRQGYLTIRGVLQTPFPSTWRSSLVQNNVKSQLELSYIAGEVIELIPLSSIVKNHGDKPVPIKSASGADFADLIHPATQPRQQEVSRC